MIKQVLEVFADDNFYDKNYPVLHGTSSSDVKPFVIMVKRKRNIFKRPFAQYEHEIIAELENYVKKDKREEFLERVNAKKQTQNDLEIAEYDEGDEAPESYREIGFKVADTADGNVKIGYVLGELELGKLDKEYFDDPDLESILQETELDTEKMRRFENEKLYLIYSVIYSERFELSGKRQKEVVVDAGVHVPVSIVPLLKSKTRAHYKNKTVPPKAETRRTRGPVYYKCVHVDYDKAEGKMKLQPGTFVDKPYRAHCVGDEDETVLAFDNEENDLAASLTDEDFKKLDKIKDALLMSENRETRKERVKKYLKWFEEALTTNRTKLTLPDDQSLTKEDCDFLKIIFCLVLPGQKNTVDLSALRAADKIQGYAIVLKLIDDLSDEQWEEIEKAWAEPAQDETTP